MIHFESLFALCHIILHLVHPPYAWTLMWLDKMPGVPLNIAMVLKKSLKTSLAWCFCGHTSCLHSLFNTLSSSPPDSVGPMSAAHSHPPHMGGVVGHPSVISTSRPLPSPMSSLGSQMNGLASPYPVITSSLGSPSVSLPSTPSMNFGPLSSPQVRQHVGVLMVIR